MLGTALIAIPLFVLSNAGVPMETGATPAWAVLLVGSLVVLVWRRPRLSLAVVPVLVLCVVSLVLLGRPMFEFGLDWIANANGDMAYYVLSATQLMHHGLQSGVDLHALADNRDFATSAQDLTLAGLRPGTQITLAGLASVTGRPPVALYMPLSLAITMSTICATGALAMQATRRWWAASVAAALLVASPLAGYGVLQQLLPQDWGLGLAVALFAWLMRPEIHQKPPVRPDLVVISFLAAGLFIVAYEVAVSLALAYGLYVILLAARRRVSLRAVGLLWIVPVLATAAATNTFLPRALGYIHRYVLQFGISSGFKGETQFGYAVVPTALAGVAGLRSLFASPESPHSGLAVVVAAALAVALLIACVMTATRGAAAGITLLSDLALGILLAKNGNEFGLFKLYMYIQPFVAATIAIMLSGLHRRLTLGFVSALLAAIVGVQVWTLSSYVNHSEQPIDLRNASRADLLPKFRHLVRTATVPVVTVTDNFALIELEGAEAGDKQLFFLSRNLFDLPWKKRTIALPSPGGVTTLTFRENPGTSRVLSRASCVVALPSGSQLTLNRRTLPEGSPNLVIRRCDHTKHLLAFIVSSLGQPATLPANRRVVSFWQLERDPFYPHRTFSGFGRYALFQILGGAKTVRVALELTTTFIRGSRGARELPPAAVIGRTRVSLPILGSGSGRVFSPPLHPRRIGGRSYIVLDMGRSGRQPLVPRPGATGLWGKSVPLDPRFLTSYVRDVSIVSSAEYNRLRAPRAIRSVPGGLANLGLEYSGIYEDGWIARESYAQLSAGGPDRLVIHALIPTGTPGQHLRLFVNGLLLQSRSVRPGELDLNLPLPASSGRRKIELRWTRLIRLPVPDGRSVAARLTFLGLSSGSTSP
jgi:hypothetical protein